MGNVGKYRQCITGNGNVVGGLRVGNTSRSVGVGIPVSRVPLPLTGGEGGEPGWGGCRGVQAQVVQSFSSRVDCLSFVCIDSNDGILTP